MEVKLTYFWLPRSHRQAQVYKTEQTIPKAIGLEVETMLDERKLPGLTEGHGDCFVLVEPVCEYSYSQLVISKRMRELLAVAIDEAREV